MNKRIIRKKSKKKRERGRIDRRENMNQGRFNFPQNILINKTKREIILRTN